MKDDLDLSTVPFDDDFHFENFKMVEFEERGINFRILTDIHKRKSSNKYMFGLLDNKGYFNWFFKKRVVATNRLDALSIFNVLDRYCTENNLGTPFAYKKSWNDTL
jgi:hypothetical protein